MTTADRRLRIVVDDRRCDRHPRRTARSCRRSPAPTSTLEATFAEFEGAARASLEGDGFAPEAIVSRRYLDLRDVGQSWNLAVDAPDGSWSTESVERLREAFDQQHQQLYAYHVATEPVEIVNAGLSTTGIIRKPRLRDVPRVGRGPAVLEEMDSTTVVEPGYAAEVLEYGILLVSAAA